MGVSLQLPLGIFSVRLNLLVLTPPNLGCALGDGRDQDYWNSAMDRRITKGCATGARETD